MSIRLIIKKYAAATDKLVYYCFAILLLNRKLTNGWISIERWYEQLMLLNALHLPAPTFFKDCDDELTDDIKKILNQTVC